MNSGIVKSVPKSIVKNDLRWPILPKLYHKVSKFILLFPFFFGLQGRTASSNSHEALSLQVPNGFMTTLGPCVPTPSDGILFSLRTVPREKKPEATFSLFPSRSVLLFFLFFALFCLFHFNSRNVIYIVSVFLLY